MIRRCGYAYRWGREESAENCTDRINYVATSFDDYLRTRRAEIDVRLRDALRPQAGLPDELLQAMRYSLLAPGKRLRPLLVLLAAEAVSAASCDPWPAAVAVEMVHVYSLIHDDLPAMDDDDLRRGQPTCHKKFNEATAILAGDALLTMAFQTLAEGYPSAAGAACCSDLARAAGAAGMVGGQVDDLAMERAEQTGQRTADELEFIHTRKTGALIRVSLRLGARAAFAASAEGPPAEALERLDAYGRRLGLAFQITDDLLDVEGQSASAGKRVGKDASRNKLTYPGLLGVEESRRRAQALGAGAVEAVAAFGSAAARLNDLVRFVLTRDR
jgi:geranylgeranyl diphosphate synthase type II